MSRHADKYDDLTLQGLRELSAIFQRAAIAAEVERLKAEACQRQQQQLQRLALTRYVPCRFANNVEQWPQFEF